MVSKNFSVKFVTSMEFMMALALLLLLMLKKLRKSPSGSSIKLKIDFNFFISYKMEIKGTIKTITIVQFCYKTDFQI